MPTEATSTPAGSRPWSFVRGAPIRRKDLHDRFGGVRQGGVSPSSDTPNVFLFTDDTANEAHGYVRDRWASPDLFLYCGEGQQDQDQTLGRYNGSILRHRHEGRALRLFRGWRGVVTYEGELELDAAEPHFWVVGPNRNGVDRRVVMFRLRPQGFVGPTEPGAAPSEGLAPDESTVRKARGIANGPYRPADESVTRARPLPFTVDPDVVDRALQSHATTQNLLAEWLAAAGCTPFSPRAEEPSYDLAWRDAQRVFVAEVKSLTRLNEVGQLRLGLGQVLDYSEQLHASPVLMVERRPLSARWQSLCERLGVNLLWPARLLEITPSELH